jgi:hypothetical protein
MGAHLFVGEPADLGGVAQHLDADVNVLLAM